ncbi:competence type IV pilus major pilin ComGC [Pullulanibacillus sp. KACC 23026]|uniref:competence type IV pilus major pilin ComGC n=1 Tax=Pullulanibacillus sp. KACC 23026 TaxID=3028315 RepID=UPI0023AF301D|nr:competence type IV pilus major pilin ComGC [Pullulanibacillus sp. KACC 23026]WEG14289.1 competence type IV pilus major pilin ComGC [Pullulanibacillus sp. KACC 23026]
MNFLKTLLNKNAFTMIEMMIVLLIMSILLLIAVPNMTKSNTVVKQKSCEATMKLLQGEVAQYEMDKDTPLPDLQTLVDDGYVDQITCPDGGTLVLNDDQVTREP